LLLLLLLSLQHHLHLLLSKLQPTLRSLLQTHCCCCCCLLLQLQQHLHLLFTQLHHRTLRSLLQKFVPLLCRSQAVTSGSPAQQQQQQQQQRRQHINIDALATCFGAWILAHCGSRHLAACAVWSHCPLLLLL
jgi:hypothetical protein